MSNLFRLETGTGIFENSGWKSGLAEISEQTYLLQLGHQKGRRARSRRL